MIEAKELQGALETQHHSLCYFDLRVFAEQRKDAAAAAGLFAQLRSENAFRPARHAPAAAPLRAAHRACTSPPSSRRAASANSPQPTASWSSSQATATSQGAQEDERTHYDVLREFASERFAVRSFDYEWSTQDYLPVDQLPYIGMLRRAPSASSSQPASRNGA